MTHSAQNGKRLTSKEVMERLTKPAKQPCRCCSVFHDPTLCAQCQVAGCAANGKKDKCRLQASMIATMKLSEFQLRARVVELEKQNAELLTESQRLARIVFAMETSSTKSFLDASSPGAMAATGKITMPERRA